MKHAFTVLELILVIVIVGISAAAVPALVMSSTKTNEAVLLQEAITSSKKSGKKHERVKAKAA